MSYTAILDAVKTALTGTPTVASIVVDRDYELRETDLPALDISGAEEEVTVVNTSRRHVLDVVVEVRVKGVSATARAARETLVAAVIGRIDHKLSSVAQNGLVLTGIVRQIEKNTDASVCLAELTFKANYSTEVAF